MNHLSTLLATGAISVIATSASALTQDFAVDFDNSSVVLTKTGEGLICDLSNCGIEAILAPGLASTAFTLEEGGPSSGLFDFFNIQGNEEVAGGFTTFDITATLAFDPPTSSATAGGEGWALVTGTFVWGTGITWTSLPGIITAANGAKYSVDFSKGNQ